MIKVCRLETVPTALSVNLWLSFIFVCKSPSRLALKVCYEATPAFSSEERCCGGFTRRFNSFNGTTSMKNPVGVWAVKHIDVALFSVPLSFITPTIPFLWKALLWSYWAGFMTAIWIKLLTLINGGTFQREIRSDDKKTWPALWCMT